MLKDYKGEGILTKELHTLLVGIEDSPWHEDKKFTTYRICQMLKPYNVKADFQWREGVKNLKGWCVTKLLRALSPYSTRCTRYNADSKEDTEESTRYNVASENGDNSFETNNVASVASEEEGRRHKYDCDDEKHSLSGVSSESEEGEL